MMFLDNITDRLVIEHLAKSMAFTDLCKAVGKIPIKKLIVQQGKKPFINTYYVSPEEVSHLNLKHGDQVHEFERPHTKETQRVIMNTNDLMDSNTKITGALGQQYKDILNQGIQNTATSMMNMFQADYNWHFGNKQWADKPYNSPKLPHTLKISPHVDAIDTDQENLTISWKTNVDYDTLEADKAKYGNMLIQLQKGLTGFENAERQAEIWPVTKNPDGTATIQIMYNLSKTTKDLKLKIKDQAQESYVNHILDNAESLLKQNNITSDYKSDTEKEHFSDILSQCSDKDLAVFRTTGICADVSDQSAKDYIQRLFKAYVVSKTILNDPLHYYSGIYHEEPFDKYRTFKELKDTFNAYVEELSKPHLENNELKCKIKTVDETTHQKIIQQISDDWDKEKHGGFKPKIKGIYEIQYIPAKDNFENVVSNNEDYKNETCLDKNCQRDIFYHGTGAVATTLILGHSGQFELSAKKVGKMLGDGIYLADKASKSSQYLSDYAEFKKLHVTGTLMICEASLGNCAEIHSENDYDEFFPEDEEGDRNMEDSDVYDNYDTIAAKGGQQNDTKDSPIVNFNEWCVFNEEAVCPKYLIELELESTKE